MTLLIDSEEIIRHLEFFIPEDGVFEIRLLEATHISSRNGYKTTYYGYFDRDHISTIPHMLEQFSSWKGVYVTLNPCLPECLSRCNNNITTTGKSPTTGDKEIAYRRWLLIDCDADRIAGISANGNEHRMALDKCSEVKEILSSIGWAEPVVADSANGGHLLYRIDLPTNDDDLIKKVLLAMQTNNSHAKVKIDSVVHNPSRITKLYGTLGCKGDNTPERPWRMSRIISVPDKIEVVTKEQLQEMAKWASNSEKPKAEHTVKYEGGFNIDEFVAKHFPEASEKTRYGNGWKWTLGECPFNPEHKGKDSAIFEFDSGALGFSCFHNSCSSNDWQALRKLKEGDKVKADVNKPVMIDFIIEDEVVECADSGSFPEHLLCLPNLGGKIYEYSLATNPYPEPVGSLLGAVSMICVLAGGKIKWDNINMNSYNLLLAPTGVGKDRPRKVNKKIAEELGSEFENSVVETFASTAGIVTQLQASPTLLFQYDEFDTLIRKLSGKHATSVDFEIQSTIKEMYTSSDSLYVEKIKKAKSENRRIYHPCMSVYGTCTPTVLMNNLNEGMLTDGFFSRFNIFESGSRGSYNRKPKPDLPKDILEDAKIWTRTAVQKRFFNGEISNPKHPNMAQHNVVVDKIAQEFIDDRTDENDKRWGEYTDKGWTTEAGMVTRLVARAKQFALVYACCEYPDMPRITFDGMKWGYELADYSTQKALHLLKKNFCKNDYHKSQQDIGNFITVSKRVTMQTLSRKFAHLKKFERHDCLDNLKDQGVIEEKDGVFYGRG